MAEDVKKAGAKAAPKAAAGKKPVAPKVDIKPEVVEPVVVEPEVVKAEDISTPYKIEQIAGGKFILKNGAKILKKGSREKCEHYLAQLA